MTASSTPMAGSEGGQVTDPSDEKNASLQLRLLARSGFRSEAKYKGISANQWGDVIAVCEDGTRYQTMRAALELLEALKEADRALRFYEWYANPKSNWAAPGSEHIRALVENALTHATANPIDTLPLGEGK